MQTCLQTKSFGAYYVENMEALGLPVFAKARDNGAAIYGHVVAMAGTIKAIGKGATLSELLGATFFSEKLAIGAGFYASFYVGAAIGSLAVATGRTAGCSSQMIDTFSYVQKNKLQFQGWQQILAHHPEILRYRQTNRQSYGLLAKAPAKNLRIA